MSSLPIPIFVALFLVLLAVVYWPQFRETPTGQLFSVVLFVNAVSLVLVGLRWSQELTAVLPVVATLAIISSALLYLAFCSLGRGGSVLLLSRDWLHLIPIVIVAISALFFWRWVDFFLISAKCLYACLFLRLALNSNSALQLVRLSWLNNTQRALWGAFALLVIGILLDIAITIDFAIFDGRHAESLVGFVSLGTLVMLSWVVVQAARGRTHDIPSSSAISDTQAAKISASENTGSLEGSDSEAPALLAKLDSLLVNDRLYADTELNLQRLARKAGVPSRIISRAINSHTGLNVSQWVNRARIDAVCRLLSETDTSVNDAMLQSGFLTKSNFNREFRRVKGCSPSEWRASKKNAGL